MSASIEGFFLKITPRTLHACTKNGCVRLINNGTLLLEYCAFSAISRVPLEVFSLRYLIFLACGTNVAGLFAMGQ
jgi:hypothetical protein